MARNPLSVVGAHQAGDAEKPRAGNGHAVPPGPSGVPGSTTDGGDQRDDAKQVLTVLLAAVARERARADQFYTRARNLLAYTTALFTAVQAAFLANLGRETGDPAQPLITASERTTVAWAAVIGLVALVAGAILLFAFADRARRVTMVSGHELLKDLVQPAPGLTPLEILVGKVANEEESWASSNRDRGRLNLGMAVVAAVAALAALTELVILYTALA